MTGAEKERIAVLDGLRALAIVLVLARHGLKPFWMDMNVPFLPVAGFDIAPFLMNGWVGVDLFFVLSGFLITTHLMKRLPDAPYAQVFATYLKRRFFRIAPAYYVVLTLVCAGVFGGIGIANPETLWGWRYVYHLLFLNDYFPSDILAVFWSLAIEAKFYLIAPLLALGLIRVRGAAKIITVLGAALAAQMMMRAYTAAHLEADWHQLEGHFTHMRNRFHLSLDGLLTGMAAAALWRDSAAAALIRRRSMANALFYGGLAALLGLMLPGLMLDAGVSWFDAVVQPAVLAAAWVAVMLGLLGGSAGYRAFTGGGTRFVALISYSLYLVHMPLLVPAAGTAIAMTGVLKGAPLWLMTLAVWLPLSMAAAALLYWIVERPFIAWAHSKKAG